MASDEVPDWLKEPERDVELQEVSTTAVEQSPVATTVTTTTANNGVDDPNRTNAGNNQGGEARGDREHGGGFTCREMFRRDGKLVLITIGIIIVMNVPVIHWVLYPFSLFSTWIHELCHGFAALMVGGTIDKLLIFPDASGLAYTAIPYTKHKSGFVSTAGYQGTAVVGCLLLLFRRTKQGPRTGMMVVAVMMMISVPIWIRNAFGIISILVIGGGLAAAAWKLPSWWMRSVYTIVCVTCTLNAITSVNNLFGDNFEVNGEKRETDAHSVADTIGGHYLVWAFLWLLFALVMAGIGLVFAIPGPDEVADFQCCGVCVDMGLFNILNKRWRQRGNTSD